MNEDILGVVVFMIGILFSSVIAHFLATIVGAYLKNKYRQEGQVNDPNH